jgi:hypothetical protein
MIMESMIMKPTIALLPDNVREQLNRRTATGLRPDPLRVHLIPSPTLRVPHALASATARDAFSTFPGPRFHPCGWVAAGPRQN